MHAHATISLILPTRGRIPSLLRLLDSLAATATRLDALEIVLVLDTDDPASAAVRHERLTLRQVFVPPGLPMGALNMAGYEAATGELLMLLNDDVIARTPGWDDTIRACFRGLADGIALVHVNDTLMREQLCTFPVVSRTFCTLTGGICPPTYLRYRIDDHIEEIFNLLAVLGERRIFYLPEVVFAHLNAVEVRPGQFEYHSDPEVLRRDAPHFDALLPQRKAMALALLEHIETVRRRHHESLRRQRLDSLCTPAAIRVPGRLRSSTAPRLSLVVTTPPGDLAWIEPIVHAARADEVILHEWRRTEEPLTGVLNRLVTAASGDLVILFWGEVSVGPGWFDALLASMSADVGLVGAQPLECTPVLLLDHMRCRHLPFDEVYDSHYFALDLALRVREAGLRTVELTGLPITPACLPEELERHERDWDTFTRIWLDSGRLDHLEDAERLKHTLRSQHAAIHAAACRAFRRPSAMARRVAGHLLDGCRRSLVCFRQRGFHGLAQAAGRRLARLLPAQR